MTVLIRSFEIIHKVLLASATSLGAVFAPFRMTFFTDGFVFTTVTPSEQTAWDASLALFIAITLM
jgi:hypothetical protein